MTRTPLHRPGGNGPRDRTPPEIIGGLLAFVALLALAAWIGELLSRLR